MLLLMFSITEWFAIIVCLVSAALCVLCVCVTSHVHKEFADFQKDMKGSTFENSAHIGKLDKRVHYLESKTAQSCL
jgi:hypothetical protein